ncbi:hypothetical protein PanWU01x14_213060 [Parasponia andersonii]|uniref:BAR domain-containing protein n=1 Tax=Parasponia andersonii TaxID=3476 RepID=A0A2P5BSX6_PARAD|nr:hypothetical protein PanWU01x14_213060 [Parasponia andersonii]
MKTSLKKLRGFALHKQQQQQPPPQDGRDLRRRPPQLDELAQASQDMQDMRDCYDSLLAAAAATANSAFEFSESLIEMGDCLLEKTALNDDEDSGKVLLMLGKMQYKLQKLIDSYVRPYCNRSHINHTITIPSESLLNELRTVEEMKRQCDEKREVYEYMKARQREKGRLRSGKGETFSMQQLQMAHDEYDQEATLFVFRLKSLKQGQSRSLLTQAARHHAAQVDQVDLTFPKVARVEDPKNNLDIHRSTSRVRTGSQSAPLFAENKLDPAEKLRQLRPSFTRKFHSYVLPTPIDKKGPVSTGAGNPVNHTVQKNLNEGLQNLWHSTPLEPKKYEKILQDGKVSPPTVTKAESVLKESNNNIVTPQLPPPLLDGHIFSRHDPIAASDSKKIKRQFYSGPITSKPWSTKPVASKPPQLFSGPILRNPVPQPSSSPPKASSGASPTFMSSPKISELHELPRPPVSSSFQSSRSSGLVGHSAPLVSRAQVHSSKKMVTKSPLPRPPQAISRSLSIPSSDTRVVDLHVSKPMEVPLNSLIAEQLASPPLSPITLSNM